MKKPNLTIDAPSGEMLKFRNSIVGLVKQDHPDLSVRQIAVLLTCYTEELPQTVRGLAFKLSLSKPAITRALDRLTGYSLVRRRTDPDDRRSIFTVITREGIIFMQQLQKIIDPVIYYHNEPADEKPNLTAAQTTSLYATIRKRQRSETTQCASPVDAALKTAIAHAGKSGDLSITSGDVSVTIKTPKKAYGRGQNPVIQHIDE